MAPYSNFRNIDLGGFHGGNCNFSINSSRSGWLAAIGFPSERNPRGHQSNLAGLQSQDPSEGETENATLPRFFHVIRHAVQGIDHALPHPGGIRYIGVLANLRELPPPDVQRCLGWRVDPVLVTVFVLWFGIFSFPVQNFALPTSQSKSSWIRVCVAPYLTVQQLTPRKMSLTDAIPQSGNRF
jgi:hypothetical protein